MNPLPHIPLSELVITGLAVIGIALPVLGALVVVIPYVMAVLVALVRRDPGGPFIPHRHRMRSRLLGTTCFTLGLLALLAVQPRYYRVAPARAAAPVDSLELQLLASIAPEVAPLVDSARCVGLVVGIVEPSRNHVFGFGRRSLDQNAAPDGASVFEIGSLTQVFTASLLARMAEQGTVRMDQSIQSLLPDTVSVPTFGERPIELQHLASYTSGLPRLSAVRAFPSLDLFPPLARLGSAQSAVSLYRFLSSSDIPCEPGTRVDDSDLGMGLLGHVLERAGRASYETLLRREICEPLGMKDTRIQLTADMRGRMAPGTQLGWGSWRGWRAASPSLRWQGGALAGATDLCSTANDLLAFVRAQLGLTPTPLAAALAETRVPRYRVPGRPDVGLGWYIDAAHTPAPLVWQHGSAGACRSYVAFLENGGLGVVVLSNSPVDVDRLGLAILKRLSGRIS